MVISTHLPPPVMIDSTAVLERRDPHVVLQLRHVLFGRGFLREGPRQHELGLENSARALDHAVQGRRHPALDRVKNPSLHLVDRLACVAFVPAAVEVLGHRAELDDQVVGEILRLDFAALLPPQPNELRPHPRP